MRNRKRKVPNLHLHSNGPEKYREEKSFEYSTETVDVDANVKKVLNLYL